MYWQPSARRWRTNHHILYTIRYHLVKALTLHALSIQFLCIVLGNTAYAWKPFVIHLLFDIYLYISYAKSTEFILGVSVLKPAFVSWWNSLILPVIFHLPSISFLWNHCFNEIYIKLIFNSELIFNELITKWSLTNHCSSQVHWIMVCTANLSKEQKSNITF